MDNPFWKYMICNARSNAYSARRTFNFLWNGQRGPGEIVVFCFDREGRTETILPDGRSVFIGGEHEDFYDPDFYIYNDVVVINHAWPLEERRASGIIIYGYPTDVFPPTDYHTATYVEELHGESWIYVIGALGYKGSRSRVETEVYRLRVADFSMHKVEVTGESPEGGWWGHVVRLEKWMGRQFIAVFWKGSKCVLDLEASHWFVPSKEHAMNISLRTPRQSNISC